MYESVGMKLMKTIKELNKIELYDTQLTLGIFKTIMENKIREKIDEISNYIDSQASAYSVNEDVFADKKQEILDKYKLELLKLKHEYERRILNIQIEMQSAENNQKIALANCKKTCDEKKEMLNTPQYQEYFNKKEYWKQMMENAPDTETYNKFSNAIKNNPDPLAGYTKKANAYLKKFNNYNKIIDECVIETEICKNEFINDINSIVVINGEVALTKKSNAFSQFINKIKNIFSGKAKFQEFVIGNLENNLSQIVNDSQNIVGQIQDKSLNFVATLMVMREKYNNELKSVIG